jgi:hypothetical protein
MSALHNIAVKIPGSTMPISALGYHLALVVYSFRLHPQMHPIHVNLTGASSGE